MSARGFEATILLPAAGKVDKCEPLEYGSRHPNQ